jgi:hypothetical protein
MIGVADHGGRIAGGQGLRTEDPHAGVVYRPVTKRACKVRATSTSPLRQGPHIADVDAVIAHHAVGDRAFTVVFDGYKNPDIDPA